LERTKGQLEKIPDLENADDWDSIRKDAHLIKGAAFTMSGSELGKAAALLEQASLKAARDEVKTAYLMLCKAFDRFNKEAQAYISSRS
jgi:HPt (histidine-containing phosphotransfer) domain-containing protein